VRSLSYQGSTVLDVFAGSGVSSRVAIENRRHSISSDSDPTFPVYFRRHLDQLEAGSVLDYRLIEGPEWSSHPVFRGKTDER
jgi:site-specific DNA-methyltransferase (adenine-specific)